MGINPEQSYSFSVSAYDDIGNESGLASVLIEATTEIGSNKEKQTIIFAAGQTVFINSQYETSETYTIINISGKIVKSGQIQYGDNTIIVNSGSGIYILIPLYWYFSNKIYYF